MSSAFGFLLMLGFAAAQGGVIFATAFLALRSRRADRRVARVPAMMVSYCAWVFVTIVGYALLGGGGGLMGGFGFVLFLCFTALISTVVYSAAWMLTPSLNRDIYND